MAGDYFPTMFINPNMWFQSPQSNIWFPNKFGTHNLNTTYLQSIQFSVFKQNPSEVHGIKPLETIQELTIFQTIGIAWTGEECLDDEKINWSKEGF